MVFPEEGWLCDGVNRWGERAIGSDFQHVFPVILFIQHTVLILVVNPVPVAPVASMLSTLPFHGVTALPESKRMVKGEEK